MTSEELHDEIQNASIIPNQETICKILNIIERLNGNLIAAERRIASLEKTAKRTADIASCLANGIQPD